MVTPLEKRIGLFGGSFNPAHKGHLYISRVALEKLKLDEIWWLVSPRNPLKGAGQLADYQTRFQGAKRMASETLIRVLEIEKENGLVYTIDTIRFLKQNYPSHAFAWLMGADCFLELPKWKSWRQIMEMVPIAVFPRPGYTEAAMSGRAATAFQKNRLPENEAGNLVVTKPPAWVYINCKPMAISGTKIRSRGLG